MFVATFGNRAFAAEGVTELPVNIQKDIKTVCLPVQYNQGAVAYRECVNNEVNSYTSGKANSPAPHLSLDDKYAVQQACSSAGDKTSSTYQTCVRQQIAELNALPVPVIDDLSDDEQYALQQTCFEAQSRLGAGPYRLHQSRVGRTSPTASSQFHWAITGRAKRNSASLLSQSSKRRKLSQVPD